LKSLVRMRADSIQKHVKSAIATNANQVSAIGIKGMNE